MMLKKLPEDYLSAAEKKGSVVRVDYMATDKEEKGNMIPKYAYVYLPYGYDESEKYDILYCLHGGGGEIEIYFGDENKIGDIKHTLDHMIANGDIKPVIAVSPTYYSKVREHNLDSAVSEIEHFCKVELVENLIPAIEGKFSTYAESTDRAGIIASREHRGYTGYSMGALSTWCTYINDMDCFKYFMPMSGDYWINGESVADKSAAVLDEAALSSGYNKDDIYIYAITGDKDIAYERMKAMLESLEKNGKFFKFAKDDKKGNIFFGVETGATHDYVYMPLYFYNVLPEFFGGRNK